MAKVRIKKKVVKEFLDRVMDKAVKAVAEKYDSQIADAFYIDMESLPQDIKNSLDQYIETVNKMYEKAHELDKLINPLGKDAIVSSSALEKPFFYTPRYGYLYGDALDEIAGVSLRCLPRDTVTYNLLFKRGYRKAGGEWEKLETAKSKAIEEVRVNYGKLHTIVAESKNGNVAMEKLEALGFDCTWILDNNNAGGESQAQKEGELATKLEGINKEALFPCGDNK